MKRCPICNNIILKSKEHRTTQIYCSYKCKGESMKGEKRYCLTCNKEIPQVHGSYSKQKYCCKQCYLDRDIIPKEELLNTLNKTQSAKTTADLLGVDRQRVFGWMKKYSIKRKIVFGVSV